MKKVILSALVLAFLLAVAGCGGSGGGGGQEESYVMDEPMPAGAEGAHQIDLTFTKYDIDPDEITVKAGEKVLFVIENVDDVEDHNMVGSDINVKEMMVHPGQTVRRLWTAYDQPGEYVIGCTIHPEIRMKVMIEP